MATLQDEPSLQTEDTQASELFDRTAILERVDNDEELLKEIIDLFLEDCPRLMEDIRTAVKTNDAVLLRHAGHTLKGSVGNFAAHSAFEAARVLEVMGKDNNLAGSGGALASLEQIIVRLCPALATLVPAAV